MVIDFSEAQDFDDEPLDPGRYPAEIADAEWVTAEESNSDSGYGYFKLTFEVTEGDDEGRRAWRNYSVSPKALGFLKEMLSKVAPDFDLSGEVHEQEVIETLIGRRCRMKITHGTWQGETRHEVDDVLSPAADDLDNASFLE